MQGTCSVRTTLDRDLAEQVLLGYVRERIVAHSAWLDTLIEDVIRTCRVERDSTENPTAAIKRQLLEVNRKIKGLVDSIEAGTPHPNIQQRLNERTAEKETLERQMSIAEARQAAFPEDPSKEWIKFQLDNLADVLNAEPARAGLALRRLLGPIIVREIEVPGSKRKKLLGEFEFDPARVGTATFGFDIEGSTQQVEQVSIHFAPPPPWAAVADQVKMLYDAGKTAYAICVELKCHYSWPAKALAWWHKQRGLPVPTYQDKRNQLDKLSRAESIGDDVKRMIDEKIPLQEIARILRCHKDTVTAAKRIWYERNGLPVPNGRLLRRLRNTNSRRRAS